jgi:hypothetical protein
MALNTQITPGIPPLLWSSVQEAFNQVNLNFQEIAAGGGGGSPVDFTTLLSSVNPSTPNTYTLGTASDTWKNVYTAEYSTIPGSELNGLWAGTAQIKGISGTVDLPSNSTIGGNLIIDPIKTTFKTINVQGVGEIVANSFTDTLNLIPGDGITIGVTSNSDSIEFINTGVVDLTGTTYLGVTEPTPGRFTLTNTGVTNLTNTTALPSGRATGTGIHVDNSTGSVKITNTGVVSIESSTAAISVVTDTGSGVITLTNNAPDRDAFSFIQVPGATTISADDILQTLTINGGYGIVLTTEPLTRTLNIALDNKNVDLNASIFADNSTLLVDAVSGLIPAAVVQGTFTGTVIGDVTGDLTGNADTSTASTKVTLVATNTTAANHYIAFTNGATGDEEVRTDTDLTYNPFTNTLTAGTFSGNLQGNVTGSVTGNADTATASTKVTVVATNTEPAVHYMTFVNGATGDEEVRTDTDLTYNPSTNTLTVTNISGTTVTANLIGNTTGYHTGDVKGSVVGDDSTIIIDGVASRVVGRVETTIVRASTYIKTAVYNSNLQRNLAIPTPEIGMIIFNTATGKFEGNTDGLVTGWVALN